MRLIRDFFIIVYFFLFSDGAKNGQKRGGARYSGVLVWYEPSLRYTRGLGGRIHCGVQVTESSTNKQHHLWREDRCPVVSKQPLHSRAAAKMSQHISISLEPVLTNHAPSQTAAGSHCPAREDSAPH